MAEFQEFCQYNEGFQWGQLNKDKFYAILNNAGAAIVFVTKSQRPLALYYAHDEAIAKIDAELSEYSDDNPLVGIVDQNEAAAFRKGILDYFTLVFYKEYHQFYYTLSQKGI